MKPKVKAKVVFPD